MKQGKTSVPMGKMSGKGSGANKRDAAVATGTSGGGSTVKIRKGQVKRSTGSFSSYK